MYHVPFENIHSRMRSFKLWAWDNLNRFPNGPSDSSLELRGLTKSCSWLIDYGVTKTQPNCFNQITYPWTMKFAQIPFFFHGGTVRCQKSRFRPAMIFCVMFFGMYAIGTHLSFMFHSLAQYSEGFYSKLVSRTREESLLLWEISHIERKKSRSLRFWMAKPAFPCKYQPKMVNFPDTTLDHTGYLLEWYIPLHRWVSCNNGAKQKTCGKTFT